MGTLTAIQGRYHHHRGRILPLPPIPENASCEFSDNSLQHDRRRGKRKPLAAASSRGHHDNSLVNLDRLKHRMLPLKRSKFLEHLAGVQVRSMATKGVVQHSAKTIQELQEMLQSKCVGENVQSGTSMATMHAVMSPVLLQNVLGDFQEYGVATAKGADGKMYMCQLFRTVA